MRNLLLHYCRSEKLRGSSSLLEVSEAPGNSRLLSECMNVQGFWGSGMGRGRYIRKQYSGFCNRNYKRLLGL